MQNTDVPVDGSLIVFGIAFYRDTGETVVVASQDQIDMVGLDDDEKEQAHAYFDELLKTKKSSGGCITWHNNSGAVRCKTGSCSKKCVLRKARKGDKGFEDIPEDEDGWYEYNGKKWYKKQPNFAYTCQCK